MQTYFNAFRWMATTKPCIVPSIPMFSFLYNEIPYSTIHVASYLFKTLSWPSWPWSYGSWIYNYLCNQCLSPLMWIQILLRRCDLPQVGGFIRVLQFPPVSPIKKTDRHDITEILLKVTLNTIKQTNNTKTPSRSKSS
jgi:hypothetical protein